MPRRRRASFGGSLVEWRRREARSAHRHARDRNPQPQSRLGDRRLDRHAPFLFGRPAMSFRTRLLLAFAAATLLSLTLLAVGVRRQVTARIVAQHERRVDALARVAMQDLARENADVSARLHSLVASLGDDNRFRLA